MFGYVFFILTLREVEEGFADQSMSPEASLTPPSTVDTVAHRL